MIYAARHFFGFAAIPPLEAATGLAAGDSPLKFCYIILDVLRCTKEVSMNRSLTRRALLRLAAGLTAATWLSRYNSIAAPYQGKVKITAIKAMQIRTSPATA